MALTGRDTAPLDCGAELEPLVVQVFDDTPPADPAHQAACPHCRAALERLRGVRGTISTLAAEPVAAPPSLVRTVMDRLRRDRERVLVGAHARGTLTVTEAIVTLIAGRAALAAPDVTFATVTVVDGGQVAPLRLVARIVATLGSSLPDVADRVRAQVTRAVEELAGVPVASVDVVVDDVE